CGSEEYEDLTPFDDDHQGYYPINSVNHQYYGGQSSPAANDMVPGLVDKVVQKVMQALSETKPQSNAAYTLPSTSFAVGLRYSLCAISSLLVSFTDYCLPVHCVRKLQPLKVCYGVEVVYITLWMTMTAQQMPMVVKALVSKTKVETNSRFLHERPKSSTTFSTLWFICGVQTDDDDSPMDQPLALSISSNFLFRQFSCMRGSFLEIPLTIIPLDSWRTCHVTASGLPPIVSDAFTTCLSWREPNLELLVDFKCVIFIGTHFVTDGLVSATIAATSCKNPGGACLSAIVVWMNLKIYRASDAEIGGTYEASGAIPMGSFFVYDAFGIRIGLWVHRYAELQICLRGCTTTTLFFWTLQYELAPSVVAHPINSPALSSTTVPENLQCSHLSISYQTENALEISIQRISLHKVFENPHSWEQLKRLVEGSMRKWNAILTPTVLSVIPPPPSPLQETVFPTASGVPPISVPLDLARYVYKVHPSTIAARHSLPWFLHEVAAMGALTGPSVLSEFQEGDEELEGGFL
ncbi:hypothetical protein KSS87_010409, partial [Heliosperma pusillum]